MEEGRKLVGDRVDRDRGTGFGVGRRRRSALRRRRRQFSEEEEKKQMEKITVEKNTHWNVTWTTTKMESFIQTKKCVCDGYNVCDFHVGWGGIGEFRFILLVSILVSNLVKLFKFCSFTECWVWIKKYFFWCVWLKYINSILDKTYWIGDLPLFSNCHFSWIVNFYCKGHNLLINNNLVQ